MTEHSQDSHQRIARSYAVKSELSAGVLFSMQSPVIPLTRATLDIELKSSMDLGSSPTIACSECPEASGAETSPRGRHHVGIFFLLL